MHAGAPSRATRLGIARSGSSASSAGAPSCSAAAWKASSVWVQGKAAGRESGRAGARGSADGAVVGTVPSVDWARRGWAHTPHAEMVGRGEELCWLGRRGLH